MAGTMAVQAVRASCLEKQELPLRVVKVIVSYHKVQALMILDWGLFAFFFNTEDRHTKEKNGSFWKLWLLLYIHVNINFLGLLQIGLVFRHKQQ